MTRAFVGLGSNVGDRLANLRGAAGSLRDSPGVDAVRCSPVYETDPVGPPQPDFLNAVAEIETSLGAEALHKRLKAIEREVGRTPAQPWGPREIDLDLLLYGDERVATETLTVPHPRMTERAFVLVPLCDLDPAVTIPGEGAAAELLESTGTAGVRAAFGAESLT